MRSRRGRGWSKGQEAIYKAVVVLVAIGLPVGWGGIYGSRWLGLSGSEVVQKARELVTIVSPTPTPVPLPWLRTSGKRIVNERGEVVVLRGVNISSLYWGFEQWHPLAVAHLAHEWGANVVRIRVHEDRFLADPKQWFAKVEKEIIGPARENKMYVIIHPWIGNNQPLPDGRTAQMWQMIAAKYKNDPTVLYDLLAEPREVSWLQVRQAYTDLVTVVRQVHPRALVLVSGLTWGRRINEYADEPLPFENIVYRSNPYNHEGSFPDLFGKIAAKYPVFLGEFGPSPDMTEEDVKALLEYAQQLELGWTAWAFQSIGCPCLLSDWQTYTRSSYGEVVYQALKEGSRSGSKFDLE